MDATKVGFDIVVAGFGSPHGDDRAGWQVIATLARNPIRAVRLLSIREGTQLVGELEGCEVDFDRRLPHLQPSRYDHTISVARPANTPAPQPLDPRNRIVQCVGTRGATRRVPPDVEVFGIEISGSNPVAELSCEVKWAVEELAEIIRAELCEAAHA